jgi:Na+/melibiose symporter-like transporter
LALIRQPEPAPVLTERRPLWRDIGDGLRLVTSRVQLWAIAGFAGTSNLFANMFIAIYVLYVTRELGLPPALLGIIFGAASVGFLLGAGVLGRILARVGLGRTALIGAVLMGSALLAMVLVTGPPLVVAPLLAALWSCLAWAVRSTT